MRQFSCIFIVLGWISVNFASADVFQMPAGQTSLEFVTVDNPGNAPDTRYSSTGYGTVSNKYRIGKYEVTAGQYCAFLNAVAKTDGYGLYNNLMNYDSYPNQYGCNIKRNGEAGSYTYTVADAWANRPVNLVSWGDAARFCNWLTNGQLTPGVQDATTTERGSYSLDGKTSSDELMTVTRNPGARYAIPTEDEWYKAAYHKNDGTTGNYWDYPTKSNTMPSNTLSSSDINNANFYDLNGEKVLTTGAPYFRTAVGAFENSASPYGTFDQGGNVWEWNETAVGSSRGLRGGSASFQGPYLLASYRSADDPTNDYFGSGFRIVEVPEPSSIALLTLGGMAILRRKQQ